MDLGNCMTDNNGIFYCVDLQKEKTNTYTYKCINLLNKTKVLKIFFNEISHSGEHT